MTMPNPTAHALAVEQYTARRQRFEMYGDQLDPQAYATEMTYLNQEAARLNAEAQTIAATQRREEMKSKAVQVSGAAAGAAVRGFWGASFRSKLGLIGLALTVVGFLMRGANDESSAGIALAMFGVILLLVWFFSGLGGKRSAGTAYMSQADAIRLESMRRAAEREARREEEEKRIRDEAEQRRREAIERAQRNAASSDSGDW